MSGTIAIGRDPDRLYKLLPALYRIADVSDPDSKKQGALKALLALITAEADRLHADADQLWDDFFIETCQRWVVPYIGDLVGNIALHDLDLSSAAATAESLFLDLAGLDLNPPGEIRTRADVARTIYYRRRKGTPAMLEELARDVTGWGARAVEFFTLLDWNQHLQHLRFDCHGCPELRRLDVGDRVGGAWDTATHTVDVRRINEWDGWHNILNIGFFLWRLHSYRLVNVTPRSIGGTNWRLTFSPLGADTPLFSFGRRPRNESLMATEDNVEAPIRVIAFWEDLQTIPPATAPALIYYGDPLAGAEASVVVFNNGVPLPANQIASVNLANWTPLAQPAGQVVGIDVARGRLIVPSGIAGPITVSYFYGFSAPMGGGEYDRAKWLTAAPATANVAGGGAALQNAIDAKVGSSTIITINDSATYALTKNITLGPNESLTIQAGNQRRPHIRVALPNGIVSIATGLDARASLTLGGLLVEGALSVDGDLSTLRLLHTTLVPGRSVEQEAAAPPSGPSIVVAAATTNNTELKIQLAFSISGTLRVPSHVRGLWLLDSIVDGHQLGVAVSGATNQLSGPATHIERSTLFGTTRFLKLPLASESIFTGDVLVEEQQQGCVRFSYVPPGSKTPQQYLCQPAREIASEIEARKIAAAVQHTTVTQAEQDAIRNDVNAWLVPGFETDQYDRPEYAQLRLTCPIQIRAGAADGSEMGAFSVLKQPQREDNLRLRLNEYLPVGLEAGLIYVT